MIVRVTRSFNLKFTEFLDREVGSCKLWIVRFPWILRYDSYPEFSDRTIHSVQFLDVLIHRFKSAIVAFKKSDLQQNSLIISETIVCFIFEKIVHFLNLSKAIDYCHIFHGHTFPNLIRLILFELCWLQIRSYLVIGISQVQYSDQSVVTIQILIWHGLILRRFIILNQTLLFFSVSIGGQKLSWSIIWARKCRW